MIWKTATRCKYVLCIGVVKDKKKTTRFDSHLPGDYSLVGEGDVQARGYLYTKADAVLEMEDRWDPGY